MDPRDEKALDNMMQSLQGQVAHDGLVLQSLARDHDPMVLWPLLVSLVNTVVELDRQVGLLDARLQAIDGEV
jgi:hypothetical protein